MKPAEIAKLKRSAELAKRRDGSWWDYNTLWRDGVERSDASFIAEASPDAILWLLQRIAELEAARDPQP